MSRREHLEDRDDGADRYGMRFWVTAAAGWLVIAVGIRGALVHHVDTRPRDLATFVVGGALLHDLVFAPLVVAAGVLLARLVPGRGRAPIQVALIVGGMVALFAYPLVRGFGRAAGNPTSLPRDYTTNLLVVVGLVWLAVAVGALVRRSLSSRAAAGRSTGEAGAGGPSRSGASPP
jgi:hypothetical protein